MSRKYRAREKVINKLTRDGLAERNMVTGDEVLISKKEQSFNLSSKKDTIALAHTKIKYKNNTKKLYAKQARLQQELLKTDYTTNEIREIETAVKTVDETLNDTSLQTESTKKITIDTKYESHQRDFNNSSPTSNVKKTLHDNNSKITKVDLNKQLGNTTSKLIDCLESKEIDFLESKETGLNEQSENTTSKLINCLESEEADFLESKEIDLNKQSENTTSKLINCLESKKTDFLESKKTGLNEQSENTTSESIDCLENKKVDFSEDKEADLLNNTESTFSKQPIIADETKSIQKGVKYHQKFIETVKPVQSVHESVTEVKQISSNLIIEEKTALQFNKDNSSSITKEKFKKYELQKPLEQAESKITKKFLQNETTQNNTRLQFAEDEKAPITDIHTVNKTSNNENLSTDKKLIKLEKKAHKTNIKLEKAKEKLPAKKKVKVKHVFDEKKQKPKLKLQFEKEVIPQDSKPKSKPMAVIKSGVSALKNEAIQEVHQKISEVENENIALKAIHKTEQTIEDYVHAKRITHSAFSFVRNKPYRKVARLEEKTTKTNIKYSYRKALSERPQLQSNVFSRFLQKQKIKKQYSTAMREAKRTTQTVQQTVSFSAKMTKVVSGLVTKHPITAVIIVIALLIFFIIMSMFNTFSTISLGGITPLIASSYTASDIEIDMSELAYTEWETDLLMKAWNAPNTHPGYDQYKYNFGDISHNPYELMAYLTAKYQDFEYANIETELQQLFKEQYKLDFTETIETRYDPDTGDPYDWRIMNVKITTRSFSDIIISRLDNERQQLFSLYMQTKGNRQYIDTPFDFNWLPRVTSYYGWRIHPITGNKDYHKGVDIAVPIGTDILAGHNGVITAAYYDSGYGYYVTIDGEKGLQSKYAHCNALLVSVGQEVKKGDIIAKSGNTGNSTGAHLHLEVLKSGNYLNPLYFAITNDIGTEPVFGNPGKPMGDGSYKALLAEGEKYIGFPYVWGGSNPNTSFDCSGFVCWVLNQSGVANISRTTAQGIFNQCTAISANDAQPGDLIFFTGTYSTTRAVTHVGIYVGNGKMLHCGDPIGYASINTSYWQNHFYSFGRLN